MSGQRFDFWTNVIGYAVTGATLLSVLAVFGVMANGAGIIDLSWLTR